MLYPLISNDPSRHCSRLSVGADSSLTVSHPISPWLQPALPRLSSFLQQEEVVMETSTVLVSTRCSEDVVSTLEVTELEDQRS
jgi:hypothetical protein